MILILDNYDSFTYNLLDYLFQAGAESKVIRNDELTLEQLREIDFNAIVLSPGPGRPVDAGIMMQVIDRYKEQLPILGICLGHQALGTYFGGELVKAAYPMHGKISEVDHYGHWLFKDIDETFKVMRYHSLIIEGIEDTDLEPIAATKEGAVMALAHKDLALTGIQFHPESVLTLEGKKIINNWIKNIY